MIVASDFRRLVTNLGQWAIDDIAWAEALKPPAEPDEFAREIIFVICNSGMKNTVAREIYNRVICALEAGASVHTAFGHVGKAGAITRIWRERTSLFAEMLEFGTDGIALLKWCGTLPWIGQITRYHVAKNFGADVAKPDVHLQRLADLERTTPQALCERLAGETGYRVATIDTVLWRACALGLINSRTGIIDWNKAWEAAE